MQTDGPTDRPTTVKQCSPDLSMRGHKKVKMLVTSNFSFSTVFLIFPKTILKYIYAVICKYIEFGPVQDDAVFKELTLSQTSPGFYVSAVLVFWKHCGKRRNCSYLAISPFPTVFSTLLENFRHFYQIQNCRLQTLSVEKRLKLVMWERVKETWHQVKILPHAIKEKTTNNRDQ